jgi:hypothetical protein
LPAFEGRPFAAAGTDRLTLAALSAGFDHARAMTATDALPLRPASRRGFEGAEFENLFFCHLIMPRRFL